MAKSTWGFDVRDIDTKVRPQDDFYRYAHGKWLKRAKIPANEVRWGSFVISRVENEKRLKKITNELTRGRYPKGSAEQMIRDFYRSGMDEARREKLGMSPIKPYLARIAKINDVDGILTYLAQDQREGSGGLWMTFVDQDSKNSQVYALHVHQSGLGLPERDYYLKDDAESTRVRDAYVKHIEKIHALVGDSPLQARKAREVVMQIETALAKASMPKEEARDAEKVYHKLSVAALNKLAPEIDWPRYLRVAGIGKVPYVIAMQPQFLKAVSKLLREVPIEDWKTYLRFHLINGSAGALSKKFVRTSFDFYSRVLAGQKKMKPVWRRALAATNGSLGELLGQVYVKRYFGPVAKQKMNLLVDDLFAAYAQRIKTIDWMSPATKIKALKKLRMVSRKIGYPDKWKSYKGLVVSPDDYYGNLLRSSTYEQRRNTRKLGKKIDRAEWHMAPQTVNAYCNFNLNEIVFPAGILQAPFFDPSLSDDAVNYGSIGSVIGHEITHAFDDQGSKFDGKGNMVSWWTAKDRNRFEKRAMIIKNQFDKFTVADGVHVNGQLTLGENIADLGGVSIAYDAYQRHLTRVGKKVLDGFTPEQRFFLAFTIFDLIIARPEYEKMQVLTDPHSPAQFRINGPLANLPEFYAAFGVKKGDKLYRAPKDRAKVW